MAGKIEIRKSGEKFRFVVLTRNGEKLLQSRQFDDRQSTKRAASSLAKAVSGAEIVDATKPAAAAAQSSARRSARRASSRSSAAVASLDSTAIAFASGALTGVYRIRICSLRKISSKGRRTCCRDRGSESSQSAAGGEATGAMAPFRGRLGSEGHAFAANGYFRGTWPRLRTTHLDQAREEIATYIETYPHRPHSGLRYRTPAQWSVPCPVWTARSLTGSLALLLLG